MFLTYNGEIDFEISGRRISVIDSAPINALFLKTMIIFLKIKTRYIKIDWQNWEDKLIMNGTGFMTEESGMAICNWKKIEYFHENFGTIWTHWFLWENNIWLTRSFISNRNLIVPLKYLKLLKTNKAKTCHKPTWITLRKFD